MNIFYSSHLFPASGVEREIFLFFVPPSTEGTQWFYLDYLTYSSNWSCTMHGVNIYEQWLYILLKCTCGIRVQKAQCCTFSKNLDRLSRFLQAKFLGIMEWKVPVLESVHACQSLVHCLRMSLYTKLCLLYICSYKCNIINGVSSCSIKFLLVLHHRLLEFLIQNKGWDECLSEKIFKIGLIFPKLV